ncbi:MAG: PrsW family glutamic-type intramembrane protease [Methanomicrobiales archaeon]|nr:PrsW family glutamic-type intramembrane protease [Methanomicrobiales archaeon]
MNTLVIAAVAAAPAIFWLWYFYRKDRYEPEPKFLILRTFLLGMGVTIPVAFIEGILPLSDLILAVLAAPVIEELAKYMVVKRTVYQNREFDEPMDGVVYAASAALGFATLENIVYITSAYLTSPVEDVLVVYALRALLSVPGHALFSSMWGYALGRAKFDPAHKTGFILLGLALAMLLHGIFNFILYSSPLLALGVFVLVLVAWWAVLRLMKDALRRSPFS